MNPYGAAAAASIQLANPWPWPDIKFNGGPFFPLPNSFMTIPLPMSPVLHPASSTLVANFLNSNNTGLVLGQGKGRQIVHGNNCPKFTLYVNPPEQSWSGPVGTLSLPHPNSTLLRPGPAGATDHPFVLIDLDATWTGMASPGLVYNIWRMSNNNYTYPDNPKMHDIYGYSIPNPDGSWTCATIQVCPMDGSYSGVGGFAGDPTGLSSSSTASGFPFVAEDIALSDFAYANNGGVIPRAIMAAVTQTGAGMPPATGYDGTWGAISLPEGTVLTWAPTAVKPAGLNFVESAIWDAIATFGLYIADMTAGSGTNISMELIYPWEQVDSGRGPRYQFSVLATSMFTQPMIALAPRSAGAIIAGTALPSAPQSPTIAAGGGSGSHMLTISWSAPASWGGGTPTGYYILMGTSSGNYYPMGYNGGGNNGAGMLTVTTNSSTLTYTANGTPLITNMISGDTYYFVVCAVSSAGMGPASTEVSMVAP